MNQVDSPLNPPNSFFVMAAQGWLELGDTKEAKEELNKITPEGRTHVDVLITAWRVYSKTKQWELGVGIAHSLIKTHPSRVNGWILRSFGLHELKRTSEAYDLLLPVHGKFPKNWTIPFNLACYCSQLNRFEEAVSWMVKAIDVNSHCVKEILSDPDLTPLWKNFPKLLIKPLE